MGSCPRAETNPEAQYSHLICLYGTNPDPDHSPHSVIPLNNLCRLDLIPSFCGVLA